MAAAFSVTVSQIPAGDPESEGHWRRLVDHAERAESDLVVLPEMPFYGWFPASDDVDADEGYRAAHHKAHLPDEAGFREASWYDAGDGGFEPVRAAGRSVGFLVCTELWAMEQVRAYGSDGVEFLVTPRATGTGTREKWLAAGRTAAVVAGAFSLSANRSERADDGPDFAGESWIFGPDGERLALTDDDEPVVTVDVDPTHADRASETYPRYALE